MFSTSAASTKSGAISSGEKPACHRRFPLLHRNTCGRCGRHRLRAYRRDCCRRQTPRWAWDNWLAKNVSRIFPMFTSIPPRAYWILLGTGQCSVEKEGDFIDFCVTHRHNIPKNNGVSMSLLEYCQHFKCLRQLDFMKMSVGKSGG